MSFLKLPSRKVFVRHLKHLNNNTDTSESSGGHQLPHSILSLSSSVWLQGIVVEIADGGSSAVLDDGTGTVFLPSCDKIASKIPLKKGMCLMVVGSVVSGGQSPVVKPVKLQDLSGTDHVDSMWPLEVIDQIQFLSG